MFSILIKTVPCGKLSAESHSFSCSPDRLHFSEMEDMTGSLMKKVLLLLSLVVVVVVPVLKLLAKWIQIWFVTVCYFLLHQCNVICHQCLF